jgi:hypothetical protein
MSAFLGAGDLQGVNLLKCLLAALGFGGGAVFIGREGSGSRIEPRVI